MPLLFLLEGAPSSIGEALERLGHAVIYHRDVLPPGARDAVVARHAILNEAILIDNDMKGLAKRFGHRDGRFAKLSLIKIACPEPQAANRVTPAMSFLELEWDFSCEKVARRMYVEIGHHFLRTHR